MRCIIVSNTHGETVQRDKEDVNVDTNDGLLAHVLTSVRRYQQGLKLKGQTPLEEKAARDHRVVMSHSVRAHSRELGWWLS
jgi:hypothetical protein